MLLVEGGRLLDGGNFFYIYHPFLWKYNMNTSGEKSMALFFFAYTMKECFRIFTFFSWTVTNIVRYAFLSWPMTFLLFFFFQSGIIHAWE